MTTERRMDSDLPRILGDIAAGPYPDYIDDVLSTTAQRRQRPTWTFPERWLPMDIATTQVPTARLPIRAIGALALIALLIAGALILYTGAQQQAPAPPFGLAANGQIAFADDGDIFAVDQVTGEVTTLIAGDVPASHPVYSPDGTRLALRRGDTALFSDIVVTSATGGDPTVVTPEPLQSVTAVTFSPSGDQLIIGAMQDGTPSLAIVGIDGSGFRWLETDGPASRVAFLPPDGGEVIFVTGAPIPSGEGLARLDLSTGAIQTLLAAVPTGTIVGTPSIRADGDLVAFSLWVNNGTTAGQARKYTMPTDGSAGPAMVVPPLTICCEGNPAWSNDGTRLANQRIYDDRGVIAIVDAATGGLGTEFLLPGTPEVTLAWSPDDRYVLATYHVALGGAATEHHTIDAATGQAVEATWNNIGTASWQRQAP